MNDEKIRWLTARCLKMYEQSKSLHFVHRLVERLESVSEMLERIDDIPPLGFWEEVMIPQIKKRYFEGITMEFILESSIGLYRSTSDRSLALELIWKDVEWKYPFDHDSYRGFVEALRVLLANEPNPPTKADWDYLEKCLSK